MPEQPDRASFQRSTGVEHGSTCRKLPAPYSIFKRACLPAVGCLRKSVGEVAVNVIADEYVDHAHVLTSSVDPRCIEYSHVALR